MVTAASTASGNSPARITTCRSIADDPSCSCTKCTPLPSRRVFTQPRAATFAPGSRASMSLMYSPLVIKWANLSKNNVSLVGHALACPGPVGQAIAFRGLSCFALDDALTDDTNRSSVLPRACPARLPQRLLDCWRKAIWTGVWDGLQNRSAAVRPLVCSIRTAFRQLASRAGAMIAAAGSMRLPAGRG